jgi:hypothetical protein
VGVLAILFAVDVLISTLCIWLASKFSFVKLEFKYVVVIVALVSLISLLPYVGWILGLILLVYLLVKVAGCSPVDAVWLVIFTKIFSFLIIFILHHYKIIEKFLNLGAFYFTALPS